MSESSSPHAWEMELLDRVRTAIAREIDLPVLLRTVVETVSDALGYSHVSLYIRDGHELTMEHQVGYDRPMTRIPVNQGVMGRVLRTAQPVLLENVESDPEFIATMPGIVSEISVPLFEQGLAVGVLNVETVNGLHLTPDNMRLILAVAGEIGIAIDRSRLYERAVASEARYRSVVDGVTDIIFRTDASGAWSFLNAAWTQTTGFDVEESLGRIATDFIHPDDLPLVDRGWEPILRGEHDRFQHNVRFMTKSGETRLLAVNAQQLFDADGTPASVTGILTDITEWHLAERRLATAEEQFRTLVEQMPAVVYTEQEQDHIRVLTYISPQIETILGYTPEEYRARYPDWLEMVHPDDQYLTAAEEFRTNASGEPFRVEYRHRTRDGRYVWLRDEALRLATADEGRQTWQGVMFDITELKQLQEQLTHQAFHDSLTGLPNRALFHDRVEHAMRRGQRPNTILAILLIDLDNFKVINDSLGHDTGDRLLVAVAERLRCTVRPGDTVARLGGDEFIVLLEDLTDVAAVVESAERIERALHQTFSVDRHELFVTASVGAAINSPDNQQASDLLRQADIAMYQVKRAGKAGTRVFNLTRQDSTYHRLALARNLHDGVERHEEFELS